MDLSFTAEEEAFADEVRGWLGELAGAHLAAVELFDHYRGKHIPSGFVGLGFSLTFRAFDRTLEDKDVDAAVDRIVTGLGQRGITRREPASHRSLECWRGGQSAAGGFSVFRRVL